MIYSRGPRCFGSPRATRTLSLPKLTLLVILTWWQVSGSGPAAAPPGGLPARWRADWDLAADVIQSLSHLNGTKRKLDADQSLLSHHLHHIVNDGRPGLRELWRIDSPCCCGCNVVTDRKAFWMLLMLTADCSLKSPCCWWCSVNIIDQGCQIFSTGVDPIFRIVWQLYSPPCHFRSSGVENPLAALPSATAALRVWLRRVPSAASYQGQTAGECPPNAAKFQWPKRLKVGLGKNLEKKRGRWNRREEEAGVGGVGGY